MMSQKQTYKYVLIGLIVLGIFFVGRSSKKPIVIEKPAIERVEDSLRYEYERIADSNKRLAVEISKMQIIIDSLILTYKIEKAEESLKKKKRYEQTQKLSRDSAILIRNQLLDSAIIAQSRVGEAESDSDD